MNPLESEAVIDPAKISVREMQSMIDFQFNLARQAGTTEYLSISILRLMSAAYNAGKAAK
jgi:hypothetical protein